jgi:hypothetical protein
MDLVYPPTYTFPDKYLTRSTKCDPVAFWADGGRGPLRYRCYSFVQSIHNLQMTIR